jgi:hypothetical protein
MFFNVEEVDEDEDDISAEEEAEIQGSWIQKENEHSWRKKSIGCEKIKRKKKIISIGHNFVVFSSII